MSEEPRAIARRPEAPALSRRYPFGALLGVAALMLVLYILDVTRQYRLPAPALEGLSMPRAVAEVQFTDEFGNELNLRRFAGRIVLLNVWATWCPPCRDEMPALDRLQRRLGGGEFTVVALSTDRNGISAVKAFYERIGIRSLAIYVESSPETTPRLAVAALPTTLIIDRAGREIARTRGAADWSSESVEAFIRHEIAARDNG